MLRVSAAGIDLGAAEGGLDPLDQRSVGRGSPTERYLNQVYFGSGSYGIEAASEEFLRVQPADLEVEQAAMLATGRSGRCTADRTSTSRSSISRSRGAGNLAAP